MLPNLKTFTIQTLGCKANQYDSAAIIQQLKSAGLHYVDSTGRANIIIINSCTVTSKADYKTRQMARKFKKRYPEAQIIVTGCYAERRGKKLVQMKEIDLIVGNRYKDNFMEAIKLPGDRDYKADLNAAAPADDILVDHFPGMTRSMVKIQDGCDQRCAYCIVPFVRGASRSKPADRIIEQLRHLERRGYKESILTGIHIGRWGEDLDGKPSLINLLREITSKVDIKIRLSSLEPNEVSTEMIDFIGSCPQIRPHFHIPLQSGSPGILKKMGRPYNIEEFVQVVEYIAYSFDYPAIGTDVIVGFPGESEEDFRKSKEIITKLPFSYAHVFPYSERPLTAAARMREKVPDRLKTERAKQLRTLAADKKLKFIENQYGRTVEAVTLCKKDIPNYVSGITDNYIPVSIHGNPTLNNNIMIKLGNYNSGKVTADIIDI